MKVANLSYTLNSYYDNKNQSLARKYITNWLDSIAYGKISTYHFVWLYRLLLDELLVYYVNSMDIDDNDNSNTNVIATNTYTIFNAWDVDLLATLNISNKFNRSSDSTKDLGIAVYWNQYIKYDVFEDLNHSIITRQYKEPLYLHETYYREMYDAVNNDPFNTDDDKYIKRFPHINTVLYPCSIIHEANTIIANIKDIIFHNGFMKGFNRFHKISNNVDVDEVVIFTTFIENSALYHLNEFITEQNEDAENNKDYKGKPLTAKVHLFYLAVYDKDNLEDHYRYNVPTHYDLFGLTPNMFDFVNVDSYHSPYLYDRRSQTIKKIKAHLKETGK